MSVAELDRVPKPGVRMTVEEFESLGLSEDSSLILVNEIVYDENGGNHNLTKRNRHHARIEVLVSLILESWARKTSFPGKVFSGEVGCVLSNDGLSVGIDVALFSIVEDSLRVLLVQRTQEPERMQWALPGGILKPEIDANLESAARRVMRSKVSVEIPHLEEVHTFSGHATEPFTVF